MQARTTNTRYVMISNIGGYLRSAFVQNYPTHLILAQPYGADERMRQVVEWMQEHRRPYIIFDNGAHEGEVMDDDGYMRLAKRLKPDVLVLPDLIGTPHNQSRLRSLQFVSRAVSHGYAGQFMYVPQGATKQEILKEFQFAQTELDPQRFIIGLGQSYLTWEVQGGGGSPGLTQEAARVQLIKDLMVRTSNWGACRYHILGGRWEYAPLARLVQESRLNFIGLDSVKPVTCTLGGTIFPEKPKYGGGKTDLFSLEVPDELEHSHNVRMFCEAYNLAMNVRE